MSEKIMEKKKLSYIGGGGTGSFLKISCNFNYYVYVVKSTCCCIVGGGDWGFYDAVHIWALQYKMIGYLLI
jgi:hypothetical protein